MDIEEFDDGTNNGKFDAPEKTPVPHAVLEVLRETAARFRSLDLEAITAIEKQRDFKTYKQKLREKAQLLLDLPARLSGLLEGIDPAIKEIIQENVEEFAFCAKIPFQKEEINYFGLSALLTTQGEGMEDKNALEEFIDTLEGK